MREEVAEEEEVLAWRREKVEGAADEAIVAIERVCVCECVLWVSTN